MGEFTGVMESLSSGGDTASSETAAVSPAADPVESPGASAPDASLPASAAEAAPTVPAPTEGQMVPYTRFHEVNTERSTFKADLDRLAWARAIPDTEAPTITEFYQNFKQDPIGTLIREVEGLAQGSPQHAQAVRSAAAKWLGGGRQASQDAMPEPDLQAQDGTPLYSAPQAQKLMEWRDRRAQAQMAKTIQPLQQWAQQAQAAQIRTEIAQEAQQWAKRTFDEWSQKPHFTDHKAEIAQLMKDRGLGLGDAYAEILVTKVLPTLSARERSSVVAQMQTKVSAGTANPTRTPAQAQNKPSSFSEAYAQALAEAGR